MGKKKVLSRGLEKASLRPILQDEQREQIWVGDDRNINELNRLRAIQSMQKNRPKNQKT